MAIYPANVPVPQGFATSEFTIRPLRASDAEADYKAVVESREMLRMWDQSDWPADAFTLDDNRADLEKHESEHGARDAFTFTIMEPSERTCLGCIYVHGLSGILNALGAGSREKEGIRSDDAFVTFWVRASRLHDHLDWRVLDDLIRWFDADWTFHRIAWGTNTADARQQSLFKRAGLAERWRFPVSDTKEYHLVFVRPS